MSERLHKPLKSLGYVVLALMIGAIVYAFTISLVYWGGIAV
jgi:hypothetical protein